MGNFLKFGLIGLGVCLALFVVSALVFVAVFNPNDYKERISEAVLKETGRVLTFDGDIGLTFFPGLGVTLGGLSLSNAQGFGPEPMASVRAARVTVRILPLFMGKIRFGQLVLDGPVLNLGRDEQGRSNWDDLVGRKQADAVQSAGKDAFDLDVAGVTVTGGGLTWDDRKAKTWFILRGMDVTTGRISRGGLFPVKVNVDFDCRNPDAKGSMSLEGQSSFDLANREYGHMDMRVAVKAVGDAIPGGSVDGLLSFQFLALDFNKETAQVTGLECSAYGATLLADGTIKGITDKLSAVTANLTLKPANLRTVMTALGGDALNTADPKALTKVGGTCRVDLETGRLALEDMELSVDGTRIVGRAMVKRGGKWPRWEAQVDAGDIDLDRYLPSDHAEKGAVSQERAKSGQLDDMVLPADVLRRLDFDMDVKVARLKVGGANFSEVSAAAKGGNGVLTVGPLSASAYGGTLKATFTADASKGAPVVETGIHVERLDVAGLSKDVTGTAEYAGIADYESTLSAQGERMRDLLATLGGKFSFSLSDGVFPGVDLTRMTRTTVSSKNKQGTVEAEQTDSTRFGSITGTGTVANGVVNNRDLEVKAPGLRADGHGALSLVTRQIDYIVKAKLVPTASGQGGKSSHELFGVMVPIRVTGTIDKPRYWVSISEYVKSLGGVVVDTVGTVLGGMKNVVKGVGSALDKSCCDDEPESGKPERKKFLGIF
ncbi:AsmA family protein [Pseudodesulfovibrio thermohalotolerans]|uniref:AsmA family protein n=1 Tax=Pseudodesulfovibrio thermohalotolerans TaxID=2880651 RepID=UPI002442E5DB|nr:AsmA family protein [Pseudodesulfovibrio thermohalotolerans]WFS61498.1 AsmA family protein [Pseudodesulfovibrio thermohalotolerans]